MREIRKPEMTKNTSTPGEAAGQQGAIGVEGHHPEHRERTQTVDVFRKSRSRQRLAAARSGVSKLGPPGVPSAVSRRAGPVKPRRRRSARRACRAVAQPIMPAMRTRNRTTQDRAVPRPRGRRAAAPRACAGSAFRRLPAGPSESVPLAFAAEATALRRGRSRPAPRLFSRTPPSIASLTALCGRRPDGAGGGGGAAGGSPRRRRRTRRQLVETLRTRPGGAAVLYLAGRDRKPASKRRSRRAGAGGRRSLCGRGARHAGALRNPGARGCVAALHYSRRSAALAAELAERGGRGRGLPPSMTHVCLSAMSPSRLRRSAPRARSPQGRTKRALFAALIEARQVCFHRRPLPYIGPR